MKAICACSNKPIELSPCGAIPEQAVRIRTASTALSSFRLRDDPRPPPRGTSPMSKRNRVKVVSHGCETGALGRSVEIYTGNQVCECSFMTSMKTAI